MGRIEDIISQLNTITDNPAKAIEDYKKATGKGAVGVMPLYVPEEIIHAAGYLPVGMWGARKKEISKARTYLPSIRLLHHAVCHGTAAGRGL